MTYNKRVYNSANIYMFEATIETLEKNVKYIWN